MKPQLRDILVGTVIALIAIVLFYSVVSSTEKRQEYWHKLIWDEGHYARIVTVGYEMPDSYTAASNLPFSPGWPYVWRAVSWATGHTADPVAVRSYLSAFLFVIGMIGFVVALRGYSPDAWRNGLALMLFAVWPGSMYFLTGYAESLYFVWLGWFFAFLGRRRFLGAAIIVALAVFTRSPAVILIPTLAGSMVIDALERRGAESVGMTLRRLLPRLAGYCAIGLLGFAAYMLVLAVSVGDPLAFVQSYDGWNRVRESRIYAFAMQTPIIGWMHLPEWDGVRLSIGQFLLLPVLIITLRRRLPFDFIVFASVGWLYFLSEQSYLQPFVDALRWMSVLFPFHYCLVLLMEKLASLWQREASVWRTALCLGVAVFFGAFYVRVVIRYLSGEWVS